MIFQINEDGENKGLLKVVKCHSATFQSHLHEFKTYEYGEIISDSLKSFAEIGDEEGWDVDDLDDFVEFHNLRSVLILERIFVESEIEFRG